MGFQNNYFPLNDMRARTFWGELKIKKENKRERKMEVKLTKEEKGRF